ncbi:hypothetical protein HRR83_004569 [Exophiala dermatitidis]|uniref:Uncharacterized protein n=1 Tax=Exophiala dermatitidis TaxID=5970 RepID=A0AAN6F131_EXODE|nr:hypothetical protein HRR74_004149 [Exophiala dermatitidis]KAJ4529222.1 hypothetical protein HRR73_000244 [Exophiala dermatitidis]KAJ4544130.1 hypothetical protein HRR76_002197 [Exophiala dermatitidis]KAJ4582599.1 hypothetical protein HRR81_001327 [Exophiala dermatitidis]KAJ4587330.1 hypothetical protein HRR82_001146 [Exophiala dermatitidis]
MNAADAVVLLSRPLRTRRLCQWLTTLHSPSSPSSFTPTKRENSQSKSYTFQCPVSRKPFRKSKQSTAGVSQYDSHFILIEANRASLQPPYRLPVARAFVPSSEAQRSTVLTDCPRSFTGCIQSHQHGLSAVVVLVVQRYGRKSVHLYGRFARPKRAVSIGGYLLHR